MTHSPLAQRQTAFMDQVLDEAAALPDGWGENHADGIKVYRGNYRSALMDALASTFERTAKYVGGGPFARVAAHHAITQPPSSWTIDDAGAGFDQSCAHVFGENPEVAELAWLEWAMLGLATAPDTASLDGAGFTAATAAFGDDDWSQLRLVFQPRAASRVIGNDLTAIWNALGSDAAEWPNFALQEEAGCLVWREGERPTFIMVSAEEARTFAQMQDGTSYGDACVTLAGDGADEAAINDAAMRAGAMLGRWLNEGLIAALH